MAGYDDKLTQVLMIFESTRPIYNKSMQAFYKVEANKDQYESWDEYWSALVKAAMPAIRVVAKLKVTDNAYLANGLMTRFSKSDLDDLVQIGALYGWKSLQTDLAKRKRHNWDMFMQNAKSGMDRGGTEDIRMAGDLPYSISNEQYKEIEGDPSTYVDDDYDIEQIEQPVNYPREKEISQALRAIDRAGLSPKAELYFRDTLAGYGLTDIAKKYGVSKNAVSQALKGNPNPPRTRASDLDPKERAEWLKKMPKNLNKVREVLGDSKVNYIDKLNTIFEN